MLYEVITLPGEEVLLFHRDADGPCRRRRVALRSAGEDGGIGGGVRLREDDSRPGGDPPDPPRRGRGPVRGTGHHRTGGRGTPTPAQEDADHLPRITSYNVCYTKLLRNIQCTMF